MVICYGVLEGGGAVSNEGVHSEAAGYHCVIYHGSPYLLTVQGGGADAGIEQVHEVVGSGSCLG